MWQSHLSLSAVVARGYYGEVGDLAQRTKFSMMNKKFHEILYHMHEYVKQYMFYTSAGR